LAVDPSSTTTGGAIHNTFCIDVTDILSLHFSTSVHLGGVTRSTNEAIIMCVTAGYNMVFIKTVGKISILLHN
jgi:LAO/AO transport system kinase